MIKAYKLSIIYYVIFSLLLVLSAYMLFDYKIGFEYEHVINYYLGNEERFIPAKSFGGILKLILPHIFVFGLFGMVLLHFLVFTKLRYKKSTLTLIYLTFITALLEVATPFMIISGFKFFAYIKLFSFFLFLILILYTCWLIFYSIVFD
ncbi:MAG: hypothetical protein A2513_04955 [Sulfurimonas sp. RIFOXYD12_FULL_33_39]|uniref:hypothetical protein n=1 Tax=unclassified Sulfurimonas TaxID=2623549 RepID=UPI0008BADD0B|nr:MULTISPECIES: hypothetical protein [unclassified Sulfurimonas]OHE01082.1 MAG: hypothetical protein A3G74_06880 [Sulfurimonas sp. RIFCSPLOWO2_12_FULL_34_6]OHE09475.1 MAG: hypothetical protein A2513_04955 [Sulfurimonas sp. RIFOXYD12_FULL_33_39]OHE12744.1 MAG: hypothetical protein A2530_03850 [Sulfurimonas sp. RIFOXYD2_FULL_34_21]DAB27439.1 MAG TPA: hypothetical protein CFH78_07810 [Sulfurimonas sp. UBA10385]